MDVSYSSIDTPIGTFWAAAGDLGVVRAGLDDDGGAFVRLLMEDGYAPHLDPETLAPVLAQVEEYFGSARRRFDVSLDLGRFTPFQQTVFRAVAAIPYGETRSYRDVAEAIDRPLAARAVGGAIADNVISLFVPCHRVIKSSGTVGYFARQFVPDRGVPRKLELLALEGVRPGKGLARE
jgi:methylated-DNA-[protein]-cysteine S-methyltransferase